MKPIPEHLSSLPWYTPHLAWLKSIGFVVRHDPGEAAPTRADLTRAVLTGADLTRAVLTGADLTRADLTRAVLTDADLTGADLTGAVLTDAVLTRAVLTDADLTGAEIPTVDRIDSAILAEVESGRGSLNMGEWHTCQTTHCRAGWAIHLAGAAGYALEARFGSSAAGALIYAKSRPGRPIPDFFCDRETALSDLRACAAAEQAAGAAG